MANLPSFTQQFHREPYGAISPSRPELSAKGKVIVVTGAGGMIGKTICKAFTSAGADYVAMLDVNEHSLHLAREDINRSVANHSTVLEGFNADVTNQAAVRDTFASILSRRGKIDVVVNNAGYQGIPTTYRKADLSGWWKYFEINVKGPFVVAQEFIHHMTPERLDSGPEPVLINLSSILAHWGLVQGYLVGQSAYSASKIAMTRAMEILQWEEPRIRVVNMHPGLVASKMAAISGTLEFSKDHRKDSVP